MSGPGSPIGPEVGICNPPKGFGGVGGRFAGGGSVGGRSLFFVARALGPFDAGGGMIRDVEGVWGVEAAEADFLD